MQMSRMGLDEDFRSSRFAIRDSSDNLDRLECPEIDLENGARSRDVHMRWSMVARIHSNREPRFPNDRRHVVTMIPKALGYCNQDECIRR